MIKIGFIGCGRITEHHIKCIKKMKNIKVEAVCDLNFDKAKKYAERFKITSYKSYDAMLKQNSSIQIVAIITPSGMHYENAMDILKKYKKHLIIEKPTFLKASEAKKVFKLAKNLNCKIFPVFQHRYNKSVQSLKKAIRQNQLGKIRIVNVRVRWCRPDRYYKLSDWRGTFSHDGGALTNQGVHYIDLLRHLGGEIKSVFVIMKTLGANIETEDTAVSVFNFENGAVGTLEVTTAARPKDFEASLSVVGSKGLAQIGGLAVNELQIFSPNPAICRKSSEKFLDGYGFGHIKFYKDIERTLGKNSKFKFPISEKEVFNTTKLLNSFYRADELKKFVNVKKVDESKRLGRINEKLSNLYRN